jgi:hypothetical protein
MEDPLCFTPLVEVTAKLAIPCEVPLLAEVERMKGDLERSAEVHGDGAIRLVSEERLRFRGLQDIHALGRYLLGSLTGGT